MARYKYFSYSVDQGFETFTTPQEARKCAESAIEYYQDNASEGWCEEVEQICWGEINQTTKEVNIRTAQEAEEEGIYTSGCDYVSDCILEVV